MRLSPPALSTTANGLFFPERTPFSSSSSYTLFSMAKESTAPAVLLFPSTEINLDIIEKECAAGLSAAGLSVIVMAYSAETPSEYIAAAPGKFDEAAALLQEKQEKGADVPLFVMGSALGALAAIEAVYQRQSRVKGIILESCICNLQNWLSVYDANYTKEDFPEKEEEYNIGGIMQAMEAITKPTLIFHGAQDSVTGVAAAEKLQAASGARNKKFFVIPSAPYPEKMPLSHFGGSHYFVEIRSFIDTVCGINTWRQRRRQKRLQRDDGGGE